MLKAFDYVDRISDRAAIQSTERYHRELKLARAAVDRVFQPEGERICRCPGCLCDKPTLFFQKWEVPYFYCPQCGSVFTSVDDETLREYQNDDALRTFRASEESQREAEEKREQSWNELLDWFTFRCFRYMGRNKGLRVVSGGERYRGFTAMMESSDLCKSYEILTEGSEIKGDVALSLNLIQQANDPDRHLREMNRHLEKNGLLFLSARIGTGFDILVLKEHAQVYPYEYVSLLSRKGLEMVLDRNGFRMLDYSTPGSMDVGYVRARCGFIPSEELFIRNLIRDSDERTLQEFQRFLQKSGMSSYAHIVAQKVEEA